MAESNEDASLVHKSEKDKSSVRPGIIYLSRIPPYMKPLKVRQIFSEYGEVGRVFLQPEGIVSCSVSVRSQCTLTDGRAQQKRRKHGGNKKVMFTEGWVEFCNKKIARYVAETLNTTRIGNVQYMCVNTYIVS